MFCARVAAFQRIDVNGGRCTRVPRLRKRRHRLPPATRSGRLFIKPVGLDGPPHGVWFRIGDATNGTSGVAKERGVPILSFGVILTVCLQNACVGILPLLCYTPEWGAAPSAGPWVADTMRNEKGRMRVSGRILKKRKKRKHDCATGGNSMAPWRNVRTLRTTCTTHHHARYHTCICGRLCTGLRKRPQRRF